MIEGVLSRSVCVELSSHVFNLLFKLSSRSALGALEMQMLQEMSSTRSLQGFVARTGTNEDTNCCYRGVPALGAHSDTVGNGCHLHGSLVLERLRDLSELQVSEVLHHWTLRELEERIFLFNAEVASSLVSIAKLGPLVANGGHASNECSLFLHGASPECLHHQAFT